ncbi:BTB/POZ domain-containing protein 7 [Plakobranchus ocellatus]|uniref:BTB/POZ domain-containing protein 7 n=1 Tax=Plakobranchus ocellatus TaxID=259542 RepID=A0AAV4AYJ1_9GAST|nr:BTB/POZ domain-containing protein 7 [Plakobranchus ocellatus]
MGAHSSVPDKIQAASRSTFARLSHAYAVTDGESGVKEKRKKGGSKFATLRKKLVRGRRQSKSFDHAKAMREMLSTWSVEDVRFLIQEYEASLALRELSLAANIARPTARSLRHDLSRLYDCKFCTDVDLIFKSICFPVHRAILSARSPYFKHLLAQHPEYGAQIHVRLKTQGVDVGLFSALLRYLYTDELEGQASLENTALLGQLAHEFGVPNQLEVDLKQLLDTAELSDAVLVFSTDATDNGAHIASSLPTCSHLDPSACSCMAQSLHGPQRSPAVFEFPCHRAIIAARSPFFRNLINRRAKSGEELTERALRTPSRIILDESVIPRRYARVLLSALYQDTVDMSCVLRGSPSMCSLSEIQAMVSSGRCQMTVVDEAMELYQIGQFLDAQIISQGCEDIIIEYLCLDSLLSVLSWSSEPHGSKWVHRQATAFMTEEFQQVMNSPVILEIGKDYLQEVIASDFLQCSEQEVISTVIRWGEHQLTKRIEEREPNLLSHTAHSVSKKGVKRHDLNDKELGQLLADLLPLVRVEHVLPLNSDVLASAVKRGLLEPPLAASLGSEDALLHRMAAWTGRTNSGAFLKPRLFMPYYEEAKNVLDELLSQGQEMAGGGGKVRTLHLSAIPDTLYMLEENDATLSEPYSGSPVSTVDVIAGTIPVPDRATFVKMLEREQELLQSKPAVAASTMARVDRRGVSKAAAQAVQLRVVREFGLPDSATEVLQNSQYYQTAASSLRQLHQQQQQQQHRGHKDGATGHYHRLSRHGGSHHHHHQGSLEAGLSLSSRQGIQQSHRDMQRDIYAESSLNGIMPDIAMATTAMSRSHVYDDTLELDIGDGSTDKTRALYI